MHVVMLGDYPSDPGQVSGGVEAVVLYLLQGLQRFPDLQLSVITLTARGSPKRVVQHGRVAVHYLPRVTWPSRLSYLGNIRQLRTEIRSLKPDLVHAHIAGEYAEAAADSGIPWLLTLHGIRFLEASLQPGLVHRYREWFIKREESHAVERAKVVISISPFIQSTFKAQLRGKIYNIENPIDEAFFKLPQQQGELGRILFAGRLIRRKNVQLLLQAFAELQRRFPQATLRLAGSGQHSRAYAENYVQSLKKYVAAARLEQAVTFLGELDEQRILEEYTKCCMVVLPSKLETAPMVILQAMAAGKPVVSSNAGGSPFLVEHGRTGLIVPIDDGAALAQAMGRLLGDEALAHKMGQQAAQVARDRFHVEVVAAQTRQVYRSILGTSNVEEGRLDVSNGTSLPEAGLRSA
jgi:glycosyltransferase involved in cell wall biosynthesis